MADLTRHSPLSEIFEAVMRVAPGVITKVHSRMLEIMPDQMDDRPLGVYLSVWRKAPFTGDRPDLIAMMPIGQVRWDSRSFHYTQEKAHRLATYTTHFTSWQSRDVDRKQYGGAIEAGDFILSCSGFPEHGDEAVDTLIARILHLINMNQAMEIMAISDNPLKDLIP